MPAFYKIDKERRLVLSSTYGVFSRADSVEHREKLLRDPDFDPSHAQNADFTQVTKFELLRRGYSRTRPGVRFLAAIAPRFDRSQRCVLWTRTHVGRLRESQGEMEIGVFRSLDEALEVGFLQKHERVTPESCPPLLSECVTLDKSGLVIVSIVVLLKPLERQI